MNSSSSFSFGTLKLKSKVLLLPPSLLLSLRSPEEGLLLCPSSGDSWTNDGGGHWKGEAESWLGFKKLLTCCRTDTTLVKSSCCCREENRVNILRFNRSFKMDTYFFLIKIRQYRAALVMLMQSFGWDGYLLKKPSVPHYLLLQEGCCVQPHTYKTSHRKFTISSTMWRVGSNIPDDIKYLTYKSCENSSRRTISPINKTVSWYSREYEEWEKAN